MVAVRVGHFLLHKKRRLKNNDVIVAPTCHTSRPRVRVRCCFQGRTPLPRWLI